LNLIDSAIGRRFREVRERLGLKTHEMAEKLGTSSSVISGIENAKRAPSRNILMALYALDEDVDMDWLILGTSKWGKLRKDFAMREAENKALQQRNLEKEEENLKLLAKINALQSTVDEVEVLKARIVELTIEKTKTRERKKSQKIVSPEDANEIASLNNEIRALHKTLRDQDIRIEKDRNEIAELNEKVQCQSKEITGLKTEIETKDTKIKELTSGQAVEPSISLTSEHADPADEKTEDAGNSPAGPAGGAKHGGSYKTHKETEQVHR
jgi:transcriptional regulator with XRE-family HTH domain